MDQASSRALGSPGRAVDMRSIGPGDRDLLFTWANDPATRDAYRVLAVVSAAATVLAAVQKRERRTP